MALIDLGDLARHSRSTAALVLAAALLSACAAPAAQPTTKPNVEAATIRISGSGSALPLVRMLAAAFTETQPNVTFDVRGGTNSGGAISGALAGTLDLAVTNRALSDDEASHDLEYRSFARDAVVFAAHDPSAVRELSAAQVRAIYGGASTSWAEIGEGSGPIIVLDRDVDESMRKAVLLGIMDGRSVEARSVVLASAGEMVDALSTTPRALGYTSLALLRVLGAEDITVLALDGVIPGPDTIAARTYPWTMTFGLAHRADASAAVGEFVAWVHGAAGRQIIESVDALPLSE